MFFQISSLLPVLLVACILPVAGQEESEDPQPGSLSIGAYYYPWYRAAEAGETGWMSKALRGRLKPQQLPKLGVYDSRDPKVIGEHIAQSLRAGIDFWAVSWWGPDKREDRAMREHILTHPNAGKLTYALLYESTGRLGPMREPRYDNLIDDFAYMKAHYFDHPAYHKIDGKPVVFIYLTRVYFRDRGLDELAELRKQFPDVYLIGDDVFGPRYHERHARFWDAVTAYDIYGQSMQRGGATQAALDGLRNNYENAKKLANGVGTAFIPGIAPGYNDKAVRKGHVGRARYFTDKEDSKEGDIFRAMIHEVGIPLADPKANRTIMVTSFNEWYEDTQIEPTEGGGPTTKKDDSDTGTFYTEGDRYVDYSNLYLDILREAKATVIEAPARKAVESMEKLTTPVAFTAVHPEKLKFDKPVWLVPLPEQSDTFIVLEHRTGKAWLLQGSGDSAKKTLFADWGESVTDGPWEGLVCLAFHPDFLSNRRFFVKHETMIEGQRHTVVVEKRAAKDLRSDSGELSKQLLAIKQPADNHNGGTLAFGPDGYLYVAMGDGGPQEDPKGYTQSGRSFLGKMLRLDVDNVSDGRAYGIPKDNPFVDRDPNEWLHEIWALGFREPWRFSFDKESGDLWLADVGQVRFEEIVKVRRGENHGWNVREGWEGFKDTYQRPEETYVEPLLAYARQLGVSVTGGYVYRGTRHDSWNGAYIFGDFATQRLFALREENDKVVLLKDIGKAPELPSSFGQGADGELYVVGYSGTIYHIDLSASSLTSP